MDLDSEDGSYLVSTSLKNENEKMKQIPFLKGKPSFQPSSWMQWSLGGMHLDLRYYARGMQTYHRAVLAHSSCSLKNKHKTEQCFSAFKLVKKWTTLR